MSQNQADFPYDPPENNNPSLFEPAEYAPCGKESKSYGRTAILRPKALL